MEAARALADLVEISPQIEAATVFGADGQPVGSVGVTDWWATAVARAGLTLLVTAADYRSDGGQVTQLHASLADGDVFVVGDPGELAIVAVTAARQAPGLLFYDLKRCLASLEVVEPEPEPEPQEPPRQRRRWGRPRRNDAA
jgi:predicted regulator of Ras-like GTPase activity (Roadblock/LC7/MglB family)